LPYLKPIEPKEKEVPPEEISGEEQPAPEEESVPCLGTMLMVSILFLSFIVGEK
jgi:hypothetical protein